MQNICDYLRTSFFPHAIKSYGFARVILVLAIMGTSSLLGYAIDVVSYGGDFTYVSFIKGYVLTCGFLLAVVIAISPVYFLCWLRRDVQKYRTRMWIKLALEEGERAPLVVPSRS